MASGQDYLQTALPHHHSHVMLQSINQICANQAGACMTQSQVWPQKADVLLD